MSSHSTGFRGYSGAPLRRPAALCLALVAFVTAAQAQAPHLHHAKPPSQPTAVNAAQTWSNANETVGQFPRGHIDILRWEMKNNPASRLAAEKNPEPGNTLSLDQALQQAILNQPRWLMRANMSAKEKAQLNTQLQAQVLQVRRAWTEAVSARQSAHYSRQNLEAVEAGSELGERMARVGNWSRARQMQEELQLWDARSRLQSAELNALQTKLALWQLIGGDPDLPNLPELTDLPESSPQALDTLEARALAAHWQWSMTQTEAARQLSGQSAASLAQVRQAMLQAQSNAPTTMPPQTSTHISPAILPSNVPWSHAAENALQAQADADAMQRQIRSHVRMAYATYMNARNQAEQSQNEVLRLQTAMLQETTLRYNGMLSSTWDLLASARQRIQSEDTAHQAKRQVWLAWADLQAVLSGLPYSGSPSSASSASSNTQPAGH